jgi:dienelactone hydrolase
MSACCISGTVFEGTPCGKEESIAGVPCYVASPPSTTSGRVLLLITDVFGWRFNNPRLLADRYAAAADVRVVVPDLHDGDSVASDFVDFMLKPAESWSHRVSNVFVGCLRVPQLIAWMLRHGDASCHPKLVAVIKALRENTCVTKVAALGFCWGGRHSALLGGQVPRAGVDAVIMCHPSGIGAKECSSITVPALFCCAEHDQVFSESTRVAAEAAMAARTAPVPVTTFKVYPATNHGFAARGNEGNEREQKAMNEAFDDIVAFLKANL